MNKSAIEVYFEEKNVDVLFNTLSANEELGTAYVRDTQHLVDSLTFKQSHHAKHDCYNLFYDFEPRKKYTGFENFNKKERNIRGILSTKSSNVRFFPSFVLKKDESQIGGYKSKLKTFLRTIDKPIFLYLSGGLDSEFVAMALIDSEINFTPVIFKFIDKLGAQQNLFDIQHAIDFCNKHGKSPIIKTIDIETLWESSEFIDFAEKIGMISPHLATHALMVDIISKEYSNVKHLLGGEVRYRSNYLEDDNTLANLVSLNKTLPGYNGATIAKFGPTVGTFSLGLAYIATTGVWNIIDSGGGTILGGPTTGTWTTTPAAPYEYRVTSMVRGGDATGVNAADFTTVPAAPQTLWTPITGSANQTICNLILATAGTLDGNVIFTIEVRAVAHPTPVQTSTIILRVVDNTPVIPEEDQ